jgi:hypothetical protein
MMLTLILLLQSTAASAQPLPDIELNANVRARSVTIEKQGNARLTVTTSPDGGNVVDVRAPRANGRKTLRNVNAAVKAEARIADPAQPRQNNPDQAETTAPQSR